MLCKCYIFFLFVRIFFFSSPYFTLDPLKKSMCSLPHTSSLLISHRLIAASLFDNFVYFDFFLFFKLFLVISGRWLCISGRCARPRRLFEAKTEHDKKTLDAYKYINVPRITRFVIRLDEHYDRATGFYNENGREMCVSVYAICIAACNSSRCVVDS